MSRTHDVTISAFDLDRLEREVERERALANEAIATWKKTREERDKAREQRDMLAYALFMCRKELVDVLDDINKERVSYDGDHFHEALRISLDALAAVKGGPQ